ncbi:LPXTG cell wall anchor domain-containing protein, partial [Streptococcus danieliae]
PQEKGQAGVKEIPGYKHVSSGAGNYKGQPSFGYVYEKIEEATAPEDRDKTSTDAKDQSKPADQAPASKFLPQGEGPKNAPWGWGIESVRDRSELAAKEEKATVSANSAKATSSVKTLPETGTKSDNLTLAAGAVGLLGTLTLVQSRRKKRGN